MKQLETYIAFDLEFNTVASECDIIQVSAVKIAQGKEVAIFDTFVHSHNPLKSFINGLTGITANHIKNAPPLETVLHEFQLFIADCPLIGYNAIKSDVPLLLSKGLDVTELYAVDIFEQASKRRSTDLNGIGNLKLKTVADFMKISGRGHNSLEDARMTAKIYEQFKQWDNNRELLLKQTSISHNPFSQLSVLMNEGE